MYMCVYIYINVKAFRRCSSAISYVSSSGKGRARVRRTESLTGNLGHSCWTGTQQGPTTGSALGNWFIEVAVKGRALAANILTWVFKALLWRMEVREGLASSSEHSHGLTHLLLPPQKKPDNGMSANLLVLVPPLWTRRNYRKRKPRSREEVYPASYINALYKHKHVGKPNRLTNK